MLLAGAVMLVLRLAQPTEYPVDTRVTLATADGRINDVRPGRQIKVAYARYEVPEGKRLARSVEVLPEQGARSPAPAELRVAQPRDPTPPTSTPAAAPAVPTPVAPAPPRPTPVPPAPASSAPATPGPVAPASAPSRPAPQAPAPPAPEPPVRVQEPARPQEPDATDGSAAVDWFLKGRR